ncbi:hypothetical protein [Bacillus gaemokensis]|uniref:Uncharacterized protein n=1 Tax=Bacillus gaemokensis TaxID=574375 RepID=A0A073KNF3_9BACI|nr:hypothetical protein [Bacillus gaemokensis]KEK23903.1 hypothetical protein BAGA_05575 [Bacillus gaemokensis]KYG38146.1 hypothetical protein AZF08_20575 [Bacillus gaemokensis]
MCACGVDKRVGWRQCCKSLKLKPVGYIPNLPSKRKRLIQLEKLIKSHIDLDVPVHKAIMDEYNSLCSQLKERC